MAYLPGKFARFRAAAANVAGPFRWGIGFKRERLDTTDFEAAVSADGVNLHTQGTTGPLDTTVTVEGNMTDGIVNLFFPAAAMACDLYYRKNVALGYAISYADVLDFSPGTAVRELARFSAQMQASGLVSPAA